jgi:hypothetical protein
VFLLSMLRAGGDVCRQQQVVGNGVATRWGSRAPGVAVALFSSKKFCKTGTVALSFVYDKYCPIMD